MVNEAYQKALEDCNQRVKHTCSGSHDCGCFHLLHPALKTTSTTELLTAHKGKKPCFFTELFFCKIMATLDKESQGIL